MIGFFLVTISMICAVCGSLGERMTDFVCGRRLGRNTLRTVGSLEESRRVLFVQYFIRGKEFWCWTDYERVNLQDLEDTLLGRPLAKGPPKVESACLRTTRSLVDVTHLLRQLSGPAKDFYGRQGEITASGGELLKAYLQARTFDLGYDLMFFSEWIGCDIRIVPGSVPPFRPLKVKFGDTEDKDD